MKSIEPNERRVAARRQTAVRHRHTGDSLLRCPGTTRLDGSDVPSLVGMYLGHRSPIDLRSADLRGADLTDADVTGRDLSDADLTGCRLTGVRYDRFTRWPSGFDPSLAGTVFVRPDLGGIRWAGRDLSGEDLTGANLRGAELVDANLRHALLNGAQMNGANLCGADLTGADLTDAVLAGIRSDERTVWPDGFDPKAAETPKEVPLTLDRLTAFLKTIADPARLKILGFVSAEEATVEEIADALELAEATVSHHLARLKVEGLVTVRPDGTRRPHRTDTERLNGMLSNLPKEIVRLARGGADPVVFENKVLETFFDGERLRELPARSMKKQRIVLQRIVRSFEPGERYPEKQVNEILKKHHPDFATLRRYLVDYRFMARENNVYWRL
ncbi:MAG: metalloregulator ArsR/SmtB family transcription factor [Capsulimonadales bacterium]|nr:metalloregulator ArsR/SmtB family transcription factor [Capsulimonadales bacterium]